MNDWRRLIKQWTEWDSQACHSDNCYASDYEWLLLSRHRKHRSRLLYLQLRYKHIMSSHNLFSARSADITSSNSHNSQVTSSKWY